MGNDLTGLPPAARAPGTEDAAHAVTALYREHALGLTRLAFLVLGDRSAAHDVASYLRVSVRHSSAGVGLPG